MPANRKQPSAPITTVEVEAVMAELRRFWSTHRICLRAPQKASGTPTLVIHLLAKGPKYIGLPDSMEVTESWGPRGSRSMDGAVFRALYNVLRRTEETLAMTGEERSPSLP
jgi:hypothetical protein